MTENKHIATRYGLDTVRNLFNGCKTMLNVMKNPKKVVSTDECGKNVLDSCLQWMGFGYICPGQRGFTLLTMQKSFGRGLIGVE